MGLRKLYWPCWLVQRSVGGYPGSPPVAGELIYHLPLQVHATVSDINCKSSVPCPSLVTYPGLSRETCLIPGRAEPACYGHSMEISLVLYSTPWAGPSWDLDQKVPRASDSGVANPVLSCPRGAGIISVWDAGVLACESLPWGQGTRAQGCASFGGSNNCAYLHALAWGSQGLPQDPQAHTGMHKSMLQAHSELFACKPACSSHPQREMVTWTICWDIRHKASTCVRVPVGCALSTVKTHRLQNVTQLTGSKTETFVSKAARAGTRGTRTAHVSQPVQQLPRSVGLETHSDGSLRAI